MFVRWRTVAPQPAHIDPLVSIAYRGPVRHTFPDSHGDTTPQMHTQPTHNRQFAGVNVAVDRVNVREPGGVVDSDTLTRRTTDKMRGAIERGARHTLVVNAVREALIKHPA